MGGKGIQTLPQVTNVRPRVLVTAGFHVKPIKPNVSEMKREVCREGAGREDGRRNDRLNGEALELLHIPSSSHIPPTFSALTPC